MPLLTLEDLRQHLLFSDFDAEQFVRAQQATQILALTEGDHLFHHGESAHYFYLLSTGQIQLYRLSPAGEEKVIEIVQPGQTFAEAVMFLQAGRYPVSAKAVRDCALFRIDMKSFRGLLQESNESCLRLLGHMSMRLHRAIQDIDELTLQNATMRVVHFLLLSAPEDKSRRYTVAWDTPKQILASRLSVRPETFSRILQNLTKRNLIRVEGNVVTVLDVHLLEQELAGQHV
jgi:CRP-like cAMP-binding protein